jgi:hypothetical protein
MVRHTWKTGLLLTCLMVLTPGCGTEAENPLLFEAKLDQATFKLNITVHPGLTSGQTLHVGVRNGPVGVLNCATMVGAMQRIDMNGLPSLATTGGQRFEGPFVDPSIFQLNYDSSWLEPQGPTAIQLAEAEAQMHTIDVCVMEGDEVVRGSEMDVQRALDTTGTGKFDGYGDANEEIVSVTAYAEACVAQLGDIPFFPRVGEGEGDYATYNCLDSTPIPTTVTLPDGQVLLPEEQVSACDNPQFIYSLCEPNAVSGRTNGPRVASRENEQGTHWVLLCRKSKNQEGEYNDIAMLGHNPYTGKTCYFQNALYNKTDGLHIPHPGDKVDSTASPEQSESLWRGIQGGYGSGIECVECHDSDPFIHTPWIDGALDSKGDPIIPKMGIDDGFTQGFNEAPYALVDLAGQGWTMPKVLTSPEARSCTKCHRIGDGRWAKSWMNRMEGKNANWNGMVTDEYLKFSHMYWMPPEMEGIDESTWGESEYGKAFTFIQNCADNPSDEACKWDELPTEQVFEQGEIPEIELEGQDLALEALKILGANVTDASDPRCDGEDASCSTRRCAECHSVSKNGLRHWRDLTNDALNTCGLSQSPDDMTQADAIAVIRCVRAQPEEENSVFAADKLGVFTTGARYGVFRKIFQKAYGEDKWLQPYIQFKARVSMPKGTYPALSQFEYGVLLKWFQGGNAHLDTLVNDPPAPTECNTYFDHEELLKHVDTMTFDGWGAMNKEAGHNMFACPVGGSPAECFKDGSYVDRTVDWGDAASNGKLIEILPIEFRTSFWARSSADGRFIGNGGGNGMGATITDMVRKIDIGVKASYDPGFFPDNSGFIFQGGGANICAQSMLETATEVKWDHPSCMRGTDINLYQHVARGINGGDYFIINSQFTSDSGSANNKDPKAMFNADSTMKFSPMIFNGATYEQLPAKVVDSPFEGDSVLSPSGQLVVSRLAGGENGGPLGYVIRRVSATKEGANYSIDISKEVARICISGAKANISFDERFMITHRYENDAANIYLVDLLTGTTMRVTNMPAGAKALFPHFRSDNWFYFLVKDSTGEEKKEYMVASDLAVLLGANAP